VETTLFLAQDVISYRQSITAGDTRCKEVIARRSHQVTNGLLAGDDSELNMTNTDNDLEIQREVEQKILHRMAKVHDVMEMQQGSKNVCTAWIESRGRNK
jgi:hypothetical protein